MPSYSSPQFRKDWVYAIEQDFHSPDGTTPATWAADQPTEWGHEHAEIPLPSDPATACLNADESLLAVALEHDIHIYNVGDLSLYQVLRGHVSRIDALRFHPKDPRTIVSCAMNSRAGSVKAEPEIIFWDLDEQRKQALLTEDTIRRLGQRAVDAVEKELAPPSLWKMDAKDRSILAEDIEKSITTLNIQSQVHANTRLRGRLVGNFGSPVFNSSGSSMAFLPGPRPPSNGDDQWDICIYDTLTSRIRLTLSAHRDAIMWVGFSPDDKFIASVCWDRTFRIWDHESGNLLHTFRSEGQNWTGAFSPDSRFFAGTSGQGRLWVWDVVHGVEVVAGSDLSRRWCRTLDWSPDGKQIVVGCQGLGRVVVFDFKGQKVVQQRVLSTADSPELLQRFGMSYLEVRSARYLDGGRKIVFKVGSDDGVEVYDFVENRKWRFAPEQGLDRGWASGGSFVVLKEKGMIVSVDTDAVRFWKVPFGEGG